MNNKCFDIYTGMHKGFVSAFSAFWPSKSRAFRKYAIRTSLKKEKIVIKLTQWVRIVLNAPTRRFDGETSESDKRRRLFNYYRGRVAETFVCWTFSEHKDNYVFTYTCARISLALRPFVWLNGGSELFRLNRSSMRENEPLFVRPDTRRYLHC